MNKMFLVLLAILPFLGGCFGKKVDNNTTPTETTHEAIPATEQNEDKNDDSDDVQSEESDEESDEK